MPPLATVIVLLHQYGYVFLFVIAVLEGPIITIIGAFLAAQGFFNVFIVFGVVVAGDLAGDLLYYSVGRFGRVAALERLGLRIGLSPERFERLEKYFEAYGAKAMFYAKYTQTGIIALPAAGAARMPVVSFVWYNLLGTLPKSLGLVLVGYFFGYAYKQIDSVFARASVVLFALACIVGAYVFMRQNRRLAP
ncbi:MAG: DedA family protein [Patescibacteria group bacterium]|nr:DedA family protein [Patescibacteria group bacterium]MDE1945145.1 DedA family protein [Patescibacteria group bacterium]MDE2057680.1 DedA family protein [Patescibacteria group bacterium]